MVKEVKYNGHTANPSDYECSDGDMSEILGLIPENGTLKPILPPKVICDLGSKDRNVVLLHKTSAIFNYIIYNKGRYTNTIVFDGNLNCVVCVYPLRSSVVVQLDTYDVDGIPYSRTVQLPAGSSGKFDFSICGAGDTLVSVQILSPLQDDVFYYNAIAGNSGEVTSSSISIDELIPGLEYFADENRIPVLFYQIPSGVEIYKLDVIGNTLLVLASDGMHYFLWKNGEYVHLGTKIPELPISFGLQGKVLRTQEKKGISTASDSTSQQENKEWSLAKINKFIADNATNAGKFVFPFFVRYAFRLFDGTLINHSAPVLMLCATGVNPIARTITMRDDSGMSNPPQYLQIYGIVFSLDYAVISQDDLDKLKQWSDIVSSVDIFISKPIYTYDQNVSVVAESDIYEDGSGPTRPGGSSSGEQMCVCRCTNSAIDDETYKWHSFYDLFESVFTDVAPGRTSHSYERSYADIRDDMKNCSEFYFLKSYKIEELTTQRTVIGVKEDYLQSLVNREVMTDDYDSHDVRVPRYSFVYNQRINIANIYKSLFNGYDCRSIFCHLDSPTQVQDVEIYVVIKDENKDIVVKCDGSGAVWGQSWLYFYYPNINAYRAYLAIKTADSGTDMVNVKYYEMSLLQHDFLNGAYFFTGNVSNALEEVSSIPELSTEDEKKVAIRNKLYTSDVNNPFSFPVTGINTIGTGDINGICSAVRALSQGQFGQFPLYVFASDGIWAMEVSDTGAYSAKQPITRDVCVNPDSITQIDSAVLFASDRGIMLISGAECRCISDAIDSAEAFSLLSMPGGEKIAQLSQMAEGELEMLPFREFLENCRMIYDYVNQRIIIYNLECAYAYVYSFKSKSWGMIKSSINNGVNSYPEAWAMDNNGSLIDLSHEVADERVKCFLITRPIKLDAPDILKTVDTIIQRGEFRRGDVRTALWGSRNLHDWHLVSSSCDHYLRGFQGTPYKYFRIALICDFDKNENLSGCTVQYSLRMLNRPR